MFRVDRQRFPMIAQLVFSIAQIVQKPSQIRARQHVDFGQSDSMGFDR